MDKKLLIVLVAALFLAGGVFVLTQKKQNQVSIEPAVNNSGQAQQEGQSKPPETKNFEPVQGEPDYVWFPVSELGIEIKVNKKIAGELVYLVKNSTSDPDIASVGFTTERLINIGERLGYGKAIENGGFVCGIGGFTRYKAVPADFDTSETYDYVKNHGTYIDGYFVSYASPQSGCSSGSGGYTKPDVDYEEFIVSNWLKQENSVQIFLKNSIRKTK